MNKIAIIVNTAAQLTKVDTLLAQGGINIDNVGPSRVRYIVLSGPNKGRADWLRRNHPSVYTCLQVALKKGYKVITADDFLANPKLVPVWKKVVEKTHIINGAKVSEKTIAAGLRALAAQIEG